MSGNGARPPQSRSSIPRGPDGFDPVAAGLRASAHRPRVQIQRSRCATSRPGLGAGGDLLQRGHAARLARQRRVAGDRARRRSVPRILVADNRSGPRRGQRGTAGNQRVPTQRGRGQGADFRTVRPDCARPARSFPVTRARFCYRPTAATSGCRCSGSGPVPAVGMVAVGRAGHGAARAAVEPDQGLLRRLEHHAVRHHGARPGRPHADDAELEVGDAGAARALSDGDAAVAVRRARPGPHGAEPWLALWVSQIVSVSALQWWLMPHGDAAVPHLARPGRRGGLPDQCGRGRQWWSRVTRVTLALFASVKWLQFWDFAN